MPFSPADSSIFAPLFGDDELAEIFSDAAQVRRWLEVEGFLARVEGRLGVIPPEEGETIAQALLSPAAPERIDLDELRAGVAQDGFPIIALVRQLRCLVGNPAGESIHHGATTQDVMDTGLILQVRAALEVLERRLGSVIAGLAGLAERERGTLMAGRTHSQQALPITFGFKAAGWLAPLLRHRDRLAELRPRLLVVQFGGAAGTLASLGERGIEVQAALAAELGLGVPPMPWHTQRDALAELAGWLSLVSGSLAKLAQDVILMAQSEVGELRESADPSHGGSSALPHKSNPFTSELILAAARANAQYLAVMHQALIQEHERATGAWQLEWLALPHMFANTGSGLAHATWLTENLHVDRERMQANVAASHGLMLAEALTAALATHLGQAAAKDLVTQAARQAVAEGRHLFDVAQQLTHADLDWERLRREENYLGSIDQLIDRVT